jgi:hypothetical protein
VAASEGLFVELTSPLRIVERSEMGREEHRSDKGIRMVFPLGATTASEDFLVEFTGPLTVAKVV